MIFDNLKELVIPEGNVVRIEHAGRVLWEKIIYTIQTIAGINSITIPEVANYKGGIVEITQYGKTEQDGTPTPSTPVDIKCNNGVIKWGVSGTNLLDMAEENIRLRYYINDNGAEVSNNQNFYNTKFIPVKPNTTYTLSVSEPIYYSSIMEYDSNKDFLQRTLDGSSNEKHSSMTLTTRADTAYILVGSNPSRVTMYIDDVTSINWMLNEGSTALPYEPYTEGVIADGTPEVLSVGGANLFNTASIDRSSTAYINRATGKLVFNENFLHTDFIPVTGGVEYYFGIYAFPASTAGLAWYSEADEGTYISGIKGTALADAGKVATAPEDARYVRFSIRVADDPDWDTTNYFCVNGALDAYQPYTVPQTASAADLFAVGNYKDIQGVISGTITRQVGVKVLDGTEGFSLYQSSCWAANVLNDPKKVSGNGQSICSHYAWTDSSIPSMADSSFLLNGTERLCIKDSRFETAAQFKAYLADQYAQGTPVIVLYPLAEEITESATPQTITASGTTTISTDSNHISDISLKVDYYGINE